MSQEGRCSQYLQKASPAELERAGAVVDDKVALDSGVVFFDVVTSKKLVQLADARHTTPRLRPTAISFTRSTAAASLPRTLFGLKSDAPVTEKDSI